MRIETEGKRTAVIAVDKHEFTLRNARLSVWTTPGQYYAEDGCGKFPSYPNYSEGHFKSLSLVMLVESQTYSSL